MRLAAACAACAAVYPPIRPLVSQRIRNAIYPTALARQEAIRFTTRSLTGSPFAVA